MDIQKHKKNKKILVLVIALISLLIVTFVYLFGFKGNLFGWQPFPADQTYVPPTDEQLKAAKQIEESTAENSNYGKNPNDVGSDHPNDPVVHQGDTKATATLTITAANQNDGLLQVRTLLGALTDEGTCTLTLTKDDKSISRTAGIQPTTNSSTCKGFDIPVSELSKGEWRVVVTFENAELKASGQRTVTVL
jgi:hypothetical protein